jgi:hypothetical protein
MSVVLKTVGFKRACCRLDTALHCVMHLSGYVNALD